jgi:glycosyltransferase involved in cell wall biosynthesis
MKIGYITNSSPLSGVGYRAKHILESISSPDSKNEVIEFHLDGTKGLLSEQGSPISQIKILPGVLGNKSFNWIRLGEKLKRYIKQEKKNKYDFFHATNQTLSWLARDFQPMVVTVHDLIELTDPQDKKAALLNKYLISGLHKAEHVIAISNYTAKQITKHLNIPASKITVIHNGVGPEFHQINNFADSIENIELKREFKINPNTKIVLFVGSDHPRKNIAGALEVFKKIKEQEEDIILIKVGEPGILKERGKLLEKADKLKLRESIRMVGSITDEKLNALYNISDILIYPSKNEGFGLPLIQAMACGLPVVAAKTTAIPEVVGDSGVLHNVDDIEGMAKSCVEILQDENKQQELTAKGLERAKSFSWEQAAKKVNKIYENVGNSIK